MFLLSANFQWLLFLTRNSAHIVFTLKLKSIHIMYAWHVLLLWHTYAHTHILLH